MKRPKGGRPTRGLGREEVRRIVRVYSEGTVTEPGYLRRVASGNTRVTLTFGPGGMVPKSLVDRARADIRERRRRNATERTEWRCEPPSPFVEFVDLSGEFCRVEPVGFAREDVGAELVGQLCRLVQQRLCLGKALAVGFAYKCERRTDAGLIP